MPAGPPCTLQMKKNYWADIDYLKQKASKGCGQAGSVCPC